MQILTIGEMPEMECGEMSRSNKPLTITYLYAIKMLHQAMWAFVGKKVTQVSKVEKTKLTDLQPGPTKYQKYVEFMFEVQCFNSGQPKDTYYVRLWIPEVRYSAIPRVEKVMITNPEAIELGYWKRSRVESSFEGFLIGVNREARAVLNELIPTQVPLFKDRRPALQLATMEPDMVIIELSDDKIVVLAKDSIFNMAIAKITLRGIYGAYWAQEVELYAQKERHGDTIIAASWGAGLWSIEHKQSYEEE